MPAFVRRNDTWNNEVQKIYVRRGNVFTGFWDEVVAGYVYNNNGWVKFFPRPKPPTAISVTAGNTSLGPLQQTTITAQLIDSDGNNARESRAITWSVSGGGLLTGQPSTTNTAGLATATFTSPNFNATSTITVSSTGLTSGSVVITTTLPSLPQPSLTLSPNNFGYDVTNNNYDSNNSYSLSFTGSGFGVSQWSGSVNSSFFGMYIPPRNDSAPVASQTSTQVTCTQGTWTVNPQVQITLTASRSGYTSSSTSATGAPTGAADVNYLWYYYDNNGAEQVWGPGQTRNIGSFIRGKTIYCKVTRQRGTGAFTTVNSNKITVPA